MMIKRFNYIGSVVLFILTLVSCGSRAFYEESHVVDDQIWNADDVAKFSFDIQDTLAMYNMYLDVKHHTDYPFQNLYVLLHSSFPNGRSVSEQHSLELQEKGGIWMGECNQKICELRFILRENMRFDELGPHGLSVEQYTRKTSLLGVKSISLVLEKKA